MFGFEGARLNPSGRSGKVDPFKESGKWRNIQEETQFLPIFVTQKFFLDSSMVEHSAVNRVVVGSSPTRGARLKACKTAGKA